MSEHDEHRRDQSFRRLIREHGRLLDSYLYTVERNPSTREELWADVMYLAHCHIDDLAGLETGQVRTWLRRSAGYLTANRARRAVSRRRMLKRLAAEPIEQMLSAEDEAFGRSNDLDVALQNAGIEQALQQLSDVHREVLILAALGHSAPEVAKALGISAQAVRSRLMRAREAFEKAYRQEVPQECLRPNPSNKPSSFDVQSREMRGRHGY